MTSPALPLDVLSRSLDATRKIVAGISAAQCDDPTPCDEWTVRDLSQHLIGGNFRYAALLFGEEAAAQPDDQLHDLVAAYDESAAALLEGFARPNVATTIYRPPVGPVPGAVLLHLRVVEVLVHGWDLAQATDQAVAFPSDVVEAEIEFTRAKLDDVPSDRRPFAAPQPVSDDAPAIDRLAALLGRQVPSR